MKWTHMVLFSLLIHLAAQSVSAAAPGHGKSMSTLGNEDLLYSADVQELGSLDIASRWQRRTSAVEQAELKSKTPLSGSKSTSKKARARTDQIKMTSAHESVPEKSNLPPYYGGVDRSKMKASDKVVYVPANSQVRLSSVKPGDIFKAVIDQEIKASPSVPTPIRAMVVSDNLKGAYFIGEAVLDRELKRVLVQFNRVRLDSGAAYSVKAAGLSPRGSVGLEGEYHTQAGLFFMGEMASATAAGVLDSTINRNQTTLGTYVEAPSVANSAKTGAVTALSRSADRMAEGYRQAPEYTDVTGYQQIQIIIQDDPVELN